MRNNGLRKDDLFPDSLTCLGLAAPAGGISPKAYESACRFLAGLGIRVYSGKAVLKKDTLSYVSAPVSDRILDLNELIRNPEIQGIYCLRGGYGSVHLLEQLDWMTLRKRNMPVIGYSDITVLHAAMQSKHAGKAVSACMALNLETDSRNAAFRRNFKRAIGIMMRNCGKFRRIAHLKSCNDASNLPESPLFCGNLTTLAALCGTGYLPEIKGQTIFLEDIAEPVRKLDRTLMQLRLNGFFDHCAGVILGNFKQCGNPLERMELFRRFAGTLSVPVFFGLHYGHCTCSLSLVCGETTMVRNGNLYLRDPFSE